MKRRPCEWLAAPDDDDEYGDTEMVFRVIDQWVATDQDQLLLPIRVTSKSGVTIEGDGYTAILKQYGGEGLLNDMLMSEQDLERGSTWLLMRTDNRLTVEPYEIDTDD